MWTTAGEWRRHGGRCLIPGLRKLRRIMTWKAAWVGDRAQLVAYLPSLQESPVKFPAPHKSRRVVHVCYPRTQEVKRTKSSRLALSTQHFKVCWGILVF